MEFLVKSNFALVPLNFSGLFYFSFAPDVLSVQTRQLGVVTPEQRGMGRVCMHAHVHTRSDTHVGCKLKVVSVNFDGKMVAFGRIGSERSNQCSFRKQEEGGNWGFLDKR